MQPAAFTDPNNPLPVTWLVGNTIVGGVQTKVVVCNVANAVGLYNNNPAESVWDPLFREMFACRLAVDLCETLTQSNTKGQQIRADYAAARRQA